MPDEFSGMTYLEGMNAFQSARMRGFWEEMFNLIRGKSTELLSFDDIKARLRLREEYYQGLHDVPLDKIVGSVGRYREFTSGFLPKTHKLQDRWSRVYATALGMTGLPPIEVYKVGDAYFVRDGNHRVSVARKLGAGTIQAHVTELPTSISLRPGMTTEELDALTAYAAFLDRTRLPYTRPHHQALELTEASRYDDLLGHIHLHRAVMTQRTGRELTIEAAAADWYDNVYRPALTLLRKYDVLRHMPRRTEADFYLWMVDHMNEVADLLEAHGDKPRRFSDALAAYLRSKRIPIPNELLHEGDATVEIARVSPVSTDADPLPSLTDDD